MGLIGSVLGEVTSAVGGIFAAKAQNKGFNQQQEMYNQRLADIKAHRDNLYYQDPTQSPSNQAAVTQARELLEDQAKQTKASAAVTGGTDEASALQKEAAANAIANMMQQQAIQGEARKEQIYQNAEHETDAFTQYLAESKLQQQQTKAKNITGATSGLTKSFSIV